MWPSLRLSVAASLIVVASFLLVALASTLALVRAQVESVDADLASVIRADYSADLPGARLAPLTEGIVDIARRDENRLLEAIPGIEIVPVFHQPASTVAEPATPGTPATVPGEAPPTPESSAGEPTPPPSPGISSGSPPSGVPPTLPPGTPPPAGPTAAPQQPTAAPTSPPTPGPSPSATLTATPVLTLTPVATASPTGTPSRTPTATPTPKPAPTASPTLTPTASPTPTPTLTPAPVDGTLYLHNNPTPPTGNTSSQAILPMDSELPTASVLYNYDTDRDDDPGLLIAKGGSQAWQTPPFSEAVVIQGNAKVHLWSAMKDPALGGAVTVYLRDCGGSSCVELGSYMVTDTPWQGGWVQKTFSFPVETYTLAPGHSLELKVIVEASSGDDVWFAYDTNNYKSRVTLSASASATAGLGDLAPSLLACWLPQIWARYLFV